VKTTQKKPARRRTNGARTSITRSRRAPARASEPPVAAAPRPRARSQAPAVRPAVVPTPPPAPPAPVHVAEPEPLVLATTAPELAFSSRVAPPEPERPYPARRRAVFFDVENTSRAEYISRVLEHLAIDRAAARTDFVAVGNWRVIGHDTARLLAQRGAQLVHSAPSVGIRDWSDLRIAVGAGVWLAGARPGDLVEVVSDDRAFDAVGDVAAGLGIIFRRLSYRALAGMAREEAPVEEVVHEPRGRGRRRGRRRTWHDRGPDRASERPPMRVPERVVAPPPIVTTAEPVEVGSINGSGAVAHVVEPHTAPHDEIVSVARDLIARSSSGVVTIDALANALKGRGFRRPPGSPRLITRLRRIRELNISRNGLITILDSASLPPEAGPGSIPEPEPEEAAGMGDEMPAQSMDAPETDEADDAIGNRREPADDRETPQQPARRRSRRGGRRRRGPRRSPEPAAN